MPTAKPGMLGPAELANYTHKVAAYRNLNFRNEVVYSVKDRKRDRLIAYTPALTLRDVILRVKPSEQARALLTHQRNVHAYADGFITDEPADLGEFRTARYNVFKFPTFVDAETETPITAARLVHLGPAGMLYLP